MTAITLIEGITRALDFELGRDKDVIVFGEDVGKNGGVFRATDGLQAKYGKDRVFDTPLAEAMIAGLAVGLAAQGMKPVAEIQFEGFLFPAFNQIATAVSRLRNRTRGRLTQPLVIRAPYGGGIHAPEHHSESNEALFAHLPGLRVVIPSNPSRAYGLLLAAIRNPDPVIFLEPKRVYRLVKHEVELNGEEYPLDTCFIDREGEDVTLVSWGAYMTETLKAAEALAGEGVSCEVIDAATVSPIDTQTILESVEKTGRLVIVQEAPRNGGIASQIASEVAEKGILSLLAPIGIAAGYDTVMPYARLECKYLPSVKRIQDEVRKVMAYT
ncbi:MAG TPA: alpha-ketoacid dehydrogenase subunit beta [Sphingomonadales bacterium]|nr:alpha-ketoacid dehydrogenase subunit beta [Sphingomonadales bacterium]